jgi:hypothetical protein
MRIVESFLPKHRRASTEAGKEVKPMAKSGKLSSTIKEAQTVQTIWESIPSYKMGTITLKDFTAARDAVQELSDEYASKDLELTGIRVHRDDAISQLRDLITRFRSGMRSIYGPDSVQYGQSGATRNSARKAPVRKPNPAPQTTPQQR